MEPSSGMPNVGTLPSLNPPRHDEQGRLALPFATGTERLQARVVMPTLCDHYLATLEAPAEPPTLETAPGLAERMAEEIRKTVALLRPVVGRQDLEALTPEWLHTVDSRWKQARTTEPNTSSRLTWADVYGDLAPLDLVEREADRLGAEMAAHVGDAVRAEVTGTIREWNPYEPAVRLRVPDWLGMEAR